ncbi:MAG TPA: hypothetical protein VGW34_12415 [Allosphingosinicella sp.]|nr:hypothetical protein [Allosphingosinicella sp.]
MKKLTLIALAGVAGAGIAAGPAPMSAAAEDELARELAGRSPDRPVSCVSQRDLRGNRTIGDELILFQGRTSGVVYLNRPEAGCPGLNLGRALVTRTTSSQLCAGDIATVFEPVSGAEFGGCVLGDFTPYRRDQRR